jgi:menaquinone-9 beta-reductase
MIAAVLCIYPGGVYESVLGVTALGCGHCGGEKGRGPDMDTSVHDYDAVIVGASFAGLAAASQLQGAGRVLLVDREPPGTGQTSACGTLLAVLERLDAIDALEQIHPTITINAAGRRIAFRPAYPFATFDYRRLCAILADRLDGVEIAVAPFRGREPDGTLLLGARRVRAPVVVDATGWRAVVARQSGDAASNRGQRSIGLEARHDHGGCTLEFWVRPAERPDGVLWAFPAGDHVREGVASYAGRGTGLKATLARVPHERDLPAKAVHGGLLPAKLGNPVAGDVFVVGDAAGQCLPLTGEGIRPALVWGQEAGRWARRAVDGTVSLDDALRAYRSAVVAHRAEYAILRRLQAGLLRLPVPLIPPVVRLFVTGPLAAVVHRAYWRVADPDRLHVTSRSGSPTTPMKTAT